MNTRQVVLVSATVALCACSAVGLEHLNAPLYAYTRGQGFCSTVTAVEAGGAVWTDGPCERSLSLQRTGQFDAAAVQRLEAAFAALFKP